MTQLEGKDEEQIDEGKEVGLEDNSVKENTTSTMGFAANNFMVICQ